VFSVTLVYSLDNFCLLNWFGQNVCFYISDVSKKIDPGIYFE